MNQEIKTLVIVSDETIREDSTAVILGFQMPKEKPLYPTIQAAARAFNQSQKGQEMVNGWMTWGDMQDCLQDLLSYLAKEGVTLAPSVASGTEVRVVLASEFIV